MVAIDAGRSTLAITGAGGFLGGRLVSVAEERGHTVIAVYHTPPVTPSHAAATDSSQIVAVVADVVTDDLTELFRTHGVGAVVHAAAVTPIGLDREMELGPAAIKVNVVGTANVARSTYAAGARLALVSSGAVYGEVRTHGPVTESVHASPTSLYGITKLAGENLSYRICMAFGSSVTVARVSHLFGVTERAGLSRPDTSTVREWCEAALSGRPVFVDAPDRMRDLLYVDDAAAAIIDIAEASRPRHNTYNISSGELVSDADVAQRIRRLAPNAEFNFGNRREDRVRPALSIARVQQEFGWTPRSLHDGLSAFITALRSELAAR